MGTKEGWAGLGACCRSEGLSATLRPRDRAGLAGTTSPRRGCRPLALLWLVCRPQCWRGSVCGRPRCPFASAPAPSCYLAVILCCRAGGHVVTPILIGCVLSHARPGTRKAPLGFSKEKGGKCFSQCQSVSILFSRSCERGSGTIRHLNFDSNLLLLPLSLLFPHLAHPSSVSAPPLVSNPVLTVGRQTTAPATMSTAASGTTMGLVEQGRRPACRHAAPLAARSRQQGLESHPRGPGSPCSRRGHAHRAPTLGREPASMSQQPHLL